MKAIARVWLILLLASLVTPFHPRVTEARRGESGVSQVLAPIAHLLSAPAWLVASGQDPRLSVSTGAGAGSGEWVSVPSTSNPERPANPQFSRGTLVSRQIGTIPVSSQPSIAVNPLDPDHLVLGVSALDLPSVATYVSLDGGDAWSGPHQAPYFPGDSTGVGGPVVVFDGTGRVFLAALSVGFDEVAVGTALLPTIRSRIVVATSDDGGLTWGEPVSAAVSSTEMVLATDETGYSRGELTTSFLDRPWLAIAPDPLRPDREIVSITYTELSTRFDATDAPGLPLLSRPGVATTIRLIRSTDGGHTWSDPLAISPTAIRASEPASQTGDRANLPGELSPGQAPLSPEGDSTAGAGDQVVQGAQPATLPDGDLVVAYLDSTNDGPHAGLARVMIVLSSDGGRTFSEPVAAGVIREIGIQPRTAFFRWWGSSFPRLAVGSGDDIYIAVTAMPGGKANDDGDVILLHSLDRGATWEAPVQIGNDAPQASQFFPAIDVSPDGSLVAIWGDMRDDPQRTGYDVYFSESRDNGATWQTTGANGQQGADTRASDVMSNSLVGFPAGQYLGDQFSLAATEAAVYFAWPDTRLAGADGPNQQVAFARRSASDPAANQGLTGAFTVRSSPD